MRWSRITAWICVVSPVCLALWACDGSDDTGITDAVASGPSSPDATSPIPDALISDALNSGAPDVISLPPDASVPDAIPPAPDIGPIETCADLGGADCFANAECPDDRRCANVSETPFLVCCVPGERGALPAGADCSAVDGEAECTSALCFETGDGAWCSDLCQTANDCPAALPRCAPIAFAGPDDYCQPPER